MMLNPVPIFLMSCSSLLPTPYFIEVEHNDNVILYCGNRAITFSMLLGEKKRRNYWKLSGWSSWVLMKGNCMNHGLKSWYWH